MRLKDYQSLLLQVEHLLKGQTQGFSIFEMLGQRTRELTHSAFIAQMLNPRGCHGMGGVFLNLFLETVDLSNRFIVEDVTVEIEKICGEIKGEGKDATGGRIDIYLQNGIGQVIVIENKIYANDQYDQLQRYRNATGENSIILYLTIDGHHPSNVSNEIGYHCVSYKEHIVEWLRKCLNACTENISLNNVIKQYMTTVKSLTHDFEVIKVLQESSINIRAALDIARLADKARTELKERFLLDFVLRMGVNDYCLKFENKEHKLILDDCEWCIEDNFFVRFFQGEPRWIYVKYPFSKENASLINFHEINEPVSFWMDNPDEFWKAMEPAIARIKADYGLN